MSTRSWTVGDPEPADHPDVVDNAGITWFYDDAMDEGYFVWTRRHLTRHPGQDGHPGALVGYRTADDWHELVEEYGPLREATVEEATTLTVTVAGSDSAA